MPFDLSSILFYVRVAIALLGAFIAALWLALIIWTFRDRVELECVRFVRHHRAGQRGET
ncbi:MAG: hypothetical protein HY740_00560 [Chloroflexi bacterium]|nr:hypothetical protein [Chloroflexota bacterium]